MMHKFDSQQALETVARFMAAVNEVDLAAMVQCLTDDFVQWHAHICKNFTWEEEVDLLNAVMATARLTCNTPQPTPISEGVLVRFLLDLRLADGRAALNVPAAVIFRFRGELIYRSEEFFDGRRVKDLLNLPDPLPIGDVRGRLDPEAERFRADFAPADWNMDTSSVVAERLGHALHAGSVEAVVSLLTDHGVAWYNDEGLVLDRDAFRVRLEADAARIHAPRYRDIQVLFHPGGFVWEATLEGECDGGKVTLPFFVVAALERDKISRLDCYRNAGALPA